MSRKRHQWFKVSPQTPGGFEATMQRCQFCAAVKHTWRNVFAGVTRWRSAYELRGRRTRKAPACVQRRLP